MKRLCLILAAAAILFPGTLGAQDGEAQSRFEKGYFKENAERDLEGAIREYRLVLSQYGKARKIAAKALLRMGLCFEKLGQSSDATGCFRKVIADFPGIKDAVADARKALKRLGSNGAASTPNLKTADPKTKALEKSISLDFMDTPLKEVLSFLSKVTGVNMVLDPNIFGAKSEDELMVQLKVDDIPVRQALTLILSMRELSWAFLHGALYVSTPENLGKYKAQIWDESCKGEDPDLQRIDTLLSTRKISLDFKDTPIKEALATFSKAAGIPFTLDPAAATELVSQDRTLNLMMQDLDMKAAIHLMARFNGLVVRIEKRGVTLYLAKSAPAETMLGARIRKILSEKSISVDFQNAGFSLIVGYLRDISRINIINSPKASARVKGRTINLNLKSLSLRNVLRLLLMPLGLAYSVEGEVLSIIPRIEVDELFRSRIGGKRNLRAYGGGRRTESAVIMGLIWLKNHQNPDGMWSCKDFPLTCKKGTCDGAGTTSDYDMGVTGLSLLAFLGAGHTHKTGKFQPVVKNGIHAVLSRQGPDGCFGARKGKTHWIYNHAICTLVLAETFGLTSDDALHDPLRRAVDFLLRCQNPGSGWRYGVRPGNSDTSCTAWAVMALKSAKVAGLDIPPTAFQGARAWLDRVTDEAYYKTGYTTKGDSGARLAGAKRFHPLEAMTAAAVACRIFMGLSPKNPKVLGGGFLIKQNLPKWDIRGGTIDMYYWYFGSLAMFQLGGAYWKAWNPALKNALVPTQIRKGCANGSWDPVGAWGSVGGRVYSTAMSVLSLEIYYRYARVLAKKK